MSYMKGDLLSKTKQLVKGLTIAEPRWLKAMERAPPPKFPHGDGKVKEIVLPEDVYVRKFHRKYPYAKFYEDSDLYGHYNPPPSQVFGWRVMELKKKGIADEEAMSVADMEYRAEKTAMKKAYSQLRNVNIKQGKRPPSDPFPKATKKLEEKRYVKEKYSNPKIRDILKELTNQSTGFPGW